MSLSPRVHLEERDKNSQKNYRQMKSGPYKSNLRVQTQINISVISLLLTISVKFSDFVLFL